MTEAEQPETESAAPKRSPLAQFKEIPGIERLLALAAAVFVLGFVLDKGRLAGDRWFGPNTFALVGSIAVIALTVTRLLGLRLVAPSLATKLLVFFALLPAAGFLFDQLGNLWHFVMLACVVAMAYAGTKILTHEKKG